MNFSLLISVYKNDNPDFFAQALQSVADSTVIPTEVVLICDGPLSAKLDSVIDDYEHRLPLKPIRLISNVGLGLALQQGVQHCCYDWIARFDADDLCIPERFEKQLAFISRNPNTDICGSQTVEFSDNPEEANTLLKKVPLAHSAIAQLAKSRNPLNHMTVMYRKSAVLKAGNYQNAPLYEDYDLWIRMLRQGYQFANLPEALVYVRAGEAMYQRRGGLDYVASEISMQKKFYASGFITKFEAIKNLLIRIPVRLMPNRIRALIYKLVLRRGTKA